MPESQVARLVRLQKEALLRHEAQVQRALTREWLKVERALEAEMLKTAMALAEKGVITEAMILRDERFQRLLFRARAEFAKFADEFEAQASGLQEFSLAKGISDANKALTLSLEEAGGLGVDFEMLNIEAINSIIGITADGTPLRDLLMKSYPTGVDGITSALVEGLGLGLNPKKVAEEMANNFAVPLQRALLISRTEMMRAYRLSTHEQYNASEVVNGYKRLAIKDDTTCLGCLMQDGETYATEDEFSEHPNGRCTLVPIVRGADAPTWTTGKEWLAGLSEDRQREILGGARFELYQNGTPLDDFSTKVENPTWGGSFVPTPLKDIGK